MALRKQKSRSSTSGKRGAIIQARPVESFPMSFKWQSGDLEALFNEQIIQIKDEIALARMKGKMIVYLSCPISSRGGGYHGTNVEIAKDIQRRLLLDWGEGFWILNPVLYQMESQEGRSLFDRHAQRLWPQDYQNRVAGLKAGGGDYLRMWTKVLVEDQQKDGQHLGRDFDAFYFIGPHDVRPFFMKGGAHSITAGVEEYFARQFSLDKDFRDHYSIPGIQWGPAEETPANAVRGGSGQGAQKNQKALREQWAEKRRWYVRFYSLRAGAGASLGCHDEWNIFVKLNERRLQQNSEVTNQKNDVGDLLAGYFNGNQLTPGETGTLTTPGYAVALK
ncbi:MAG: hypothetical protein KC643_29570 [Nitrospira sp.]|nr:hypothetical protein [Nitrospira sp.]